MKRHLAVTKNVTIAVLSALLVAAIVMPVDALVVVGAGKEIIEQHLPTEGELAGWRRTEHPIASTPETQKAVNELLNYTAGTYVVYTRDNLAISVYLAYWSAGRQSYRLIGGHTPDICWVGAGWRCEKFGFGAKTTANGRAIWPPQTRKMVRNDRTEFVQFWHMVSGRSITYPIGGPKWYAIFEDIFRSGVDQRGEQFFVRISTNFDPEGVEVNALAEIIRRLYPILRIT